MELFFIICLVGLVFLAIFKGGQAIFGKGLGAIIVIVGLGLLFYKAKSDLDKEEEEAKEWQESFRRHTEHEDSIARTIRMEDAKKREDKIRKELGDDYYERMYGSKNK
mgnify:FL=1|jgi:hypothetical protein